MRRTHRSGRTLLFTARRAGVSDGPVEVHLLAKPHLDQSRERGPHLGRDRELPGGKREAFLR